MTQSVHHPNGDPIPCFKLKQGAELLTDHAGLALVGSALAKFARVRETLDKALPKRSGLSVGEIVTAYVGVASRTIVSISDVFRYSSPAMFCKHWSPS